MTVVLPVRNEGAQLEQTLGAVLQQDYPREAMEVIVADGMSTDATRDVARTLQERHPNLKLVDNPGRIVSCGLNRAIRQAKGDVIIRVDGHTTLSFDYVSRCVEALRRTGADNVGGPMRTRGVGWFGEGVALATCSRFGVGGARFHYSEREEPVDTVYMGAWWRTIFERIGTFDEEMVRNQDDEFNYRILDRGGRIVLVPGIRSVYTVRDSPRALWRQYYQYGFWKARVMQKHPSQMRFRHAIPSLFVMTLAGSLAASAILPRAWPVFVTVALSYVVANLVAAAHAAARGGWRRIPAVALAFGIMHLSYGSGGWAGLGRMIRRGRASGESAG